MSANPFYNHFLGYSWSYPTFHPQLQLLANRHSIPINFTNQVQSQSFQIIINNLQENKEIIKSFEKIVELYQHLPITAKRQITSILREKYSNKICFYSQLSILQEVNLSLILPYLGLLNSLATWFRLQAEEKQFQNSEIFEFQYISNYIYTLQRYKFEQSMNVGESGSFEALLALYRLAKDQKIDKQLQRNEEMRRKVIHLIFYYVWNLEILEQTQKMRYTYFTISALLISLSKNALPLYTQMIKLIMPRVRKAAAKKQSTNIENLLLLLQNWVVNILVCQWKIEYEHYWLWNFKIICDLLLVSDKKQKQLISDARFLLNRLLGVLQI